MKIKKGWFSTEIEIKPGELSDFMHQEMPFMASALFRWLDKYLDLKYIIKRTKNERKT